MQNLYLFIPADEQVPCRYVTLERRDLNDQIHRLLDCEIFECVYLADDVMLIVDESGKIISPPKSINLRASVLYPGFFNSDPIVGDVLVACEGFYDGEPDIVPLSQDLINFFDQWLDPLPVTDPVDEEVIL